MFNVNLGSLDVFNVHAGLKKALVVFLGEKAVHVNDAILYSALELTSITDTIVSGDALNPASTAHDNFGAIANLESDPYFNSISLLLHMDGANDSTVFLDNSISPKVVTTRNTAKITTTETKYGTGSGLFDGISSALTVADNNAFDISNAVFTIETWLRPSVTINSRMNILSQYDNTNGYGLYISTTGELYAFVETLNGGQVIGPSTTVFTANTWYHVVWAGDGQNYYFFIDGNLEIFTPVVRKPGNSTSNLEIGASFGTNSDWFNGRLDDLRFTKNICRYNTSFTPPSASLPDYK